MESIQRANDIKIDEYWEANPWRAITESLTNSKKNASSVHTEDDDDREGDDEVACGMFK